MPRLIHLNGPPGIGKSTLARRYADQHPGTLDLDIDQVRAMIGGWQQHYHEAGAQARAIAIVMAQAHLDAGSDVVLPQYVGRLDQIERFEAVATTAEAAYVHVMLWDGRDSAIDRFGRRRSDDQADAWHQQVKQLVEQEGGRVHLTEMYDRLTEIRAAHPSVAVIGTREGEVDAAYERLLAVLEQTTQTT